MMLWHRSTNACKHMNRIRGYLSELSEAAPYQRKHLQLHRVGQHHSCCQHLMRAEPGRLVEEEGPVTGAGHPGLQAQ